MDENFKNLHKQEHFEALPIAWSILVSAQDPSHCMNHEWEEIHYWSV